MPKKKERKEEKSTEVIEEIKTKCSVKHHTIWPFTTVVLLIVLIASLSMSSSASTGNVLSAENVKESVIDYINNNLVQGGGVTATNVVEEAGMYKINTSYKGREFPIYATMDGRYVFVSPPVDTSVVKEAEEPVSVSCDDLEKVQFTKLEAFVVSYCPFGLQMQRIITNLPDELKAKTIIRYIGWISDGKIGAMHGEEEAQENLRQICLREEQPDKFYSYLSCFIKAGESEECLAETSVDTTALENCMNSTGLDYAKIDFDLQREYGVTGSPTLMLNGEQVSEFDFGGRNVNALKQIICCSSISPADICSENLSVTQAARGFSETYDEAGTGTTAASCG
jgi:protein-disulfide isomerase